MFTQNCLTGNSQLVLTGVKIYAHIYCELLKLAVVNIPLTASDKYAVQITVCFPHFIDGSFRFLRVKCVEFSDCVCIVFVTFAHVVASQLGVKPAKDI